MTNNNTIELYNQSLKKLLHPILHFLDDEGVSEIMINGHDEIFIERSGKLILSDAKFADEAELESAMRNIAQFAGRRLVPENPSIEARLPDGSRVHIVQSPAARKGLCATIRKFSKHKLDLATLVEKNSISAEGAEFLSICVAMAKNVIVSGGTGSGKTTLLNCLSAMIPDGERIIVLEDSSELQLQKEHVVPFEAQSPDRDGVGGMSIRDLFRASLRMRPDRVIVGECRGGEALDMIQAMTSGHSGSLSTAHANTPFDALNRLETMSLMGDVDMPLVALRAQVASAIDLIVQISRFHDGSRKITHITEVLGLSEDRNYLVNDIYITDAKTKNLVWTKEIPTFSKQPYHSGHADLVKLTSALWKKQ
jgi:pilus assembly protein CpaF